VTWRPTLGAIWSGREHDTQFRVWAPSATRLDLILERTDGSTSAHEMVRDEDGRFTTARPDAPPGTRYRYRVDGQGPFPDPASRSQPHGVHGASQVVDPSDFAWTDGDWPGIAAHHLVLYELHVGAFTPEGTFRAATAKLPWLHALGINTVLLMPVSDFPGARNWGYDGVQPFAPARCYGTPNDLRALVDAAHRAGLAVHLDVVYNHLGPDGAYQGTYSRQYYSEIHTSPWGQSINFDGRGSEHVRRYVIENALHWVHEYHMDGLRLDATHAIVDDSQEHIAAAIARAVHESHPNRTHPHLVIAEDHRNAAYMIRGCDERGWGLDGVWSDDFHHQVRRALTGDSDGYFADFTGSAEDIATTIREGWFYRGQHSSYFEEPRGSDTTGLPLSRFVIFLQNHDQVGNRAYGERLHHDVDLATYRAATVLLLVAPETPLLFMGQEWATRSPFRYFTDHHEELGRAVTAGRRREFRRFAKFADAEAASRIPDPQALDTFLTSRLDWDEVGRDPHAGMLRLYRRMLELRRSEPALGHVPRAGAERLASGADGVVVVSREAPGARRLLVIVRLRGRGVTPIDAPDGARSWDLVLSTEDAAFTSDAMPPEITDQHVHFSRPGAVVLTLSISRR
jgi:maltooligosyltrehalose trehalohydrolase